jgi:hypothetical protein
MMEFSHEGSRGQTYRVTVQKMKEEDTYIPYTCNETLNIDLLGSSAGLSNLHFFKSC